MKTNTWFALLALLVGSVGCVQTVLADHYQITSLNFSPGSNNVATSMNNGGWVTGNRNLNTSEIGVATLFHGGTFTDLGTANGGAFSSANHIDDMNNVTGWSTTDFGYRHATICPAAGPMIDLDGFSLVNSFASWSNTHGQVVGFSESTSDFFKHATLWENGTKQFVGPANTNSWADAISPDGTIAGTAENASGRQRFFTRTPGGLITMHGTLGSDPDCESRAVAINASNLVVGNSSLTANGSVSGAFTYDPNSGTMTSIGFLPGGTYTEAYCVNSLGWVGGRALDANNIMRAFLYDGISIRDLNSMSLNITPGYRLYSVTGINDLGNICGVQINESTGERTGFVGSIVPAASTISPFILGVGAARRRR